MATSGWDRFASRCFDAIETLRVFQEKWPKAWRAIKGVPTIGGALGLNYSHFFSNFDRFAVAMKGEPVSVLLYGAASGTLGITIYVVLGVLLGPVLTLYPTAVASRELGFRRGATHDDASLLLTARYARQHRSAAPVRVICLSGRYLFQEQSSPGPGGHATPLRELALKGQLEVIMPRSSPNNPTIRHRVNTYTDPATQDLRTAEGLITEIDRGKKFLRQNLRNVIHEHDMLCMWRVVLFDDVCVVQNYFPNSKGGESFMAPVFVFEKVSSGNIDCFYSAFSKMFDLLRDGTGSGVTDGPSAVVPIAS